MKHKHTQENKGREELQNSQETMNKMGNKYITIDNYFTHVNELNSPIKAWSGSKDKNKNHLHAA